MEQFKRVKVDLFLGVVRKYMQVRGPLSQKDLAELTEVGVSTMSRFLTQKTTELNPQLIAKIVAKLAIPLHEVIDFVEEDYADRFIRLVKFFKNEDKDLLMAPDEQLPAEDPDIVDEAVVSLPVTEAEIASEPNAKSIEKEETFEDQLVGALGMAKKKVTANVSVGSNPNRRAIHFEPDSEAKNAELSLREKLEALTPRQKAYMSDFLGLDMEGRDLMVDFGNAFFRYMRIKGMDY